MHGCTKKGDGNKSRLCYLGHALMENRSGLVVDATTTLASGTAERDAALIMTGRSIMKAGATLGADKGYDAAEFVKQLRGAQARLVGAQDGGMVQLLGNLICRSLQSQPGFLNPAMQRGRRHRQAGHLADQPGRAGIGQHLSLGQMHAQCTNARAVLDELAYAAGKALSWRWPHVHTTEYVRCSITSKHIVGTSNTWRRSNTCA